jgi:hypothetical protein
MGRWLTLAREDEKKSQTAIRHTDRTDKTPFQPVSSVLSACQSAESEKFMHDRGTAANSVSSVLSGRPTGKPEDYSSTVATPLYDPARLQAAADRRNREAERNGLTDRFCSCGWAASTAWRVAGQEIWTCEDCGPPEDLIPPPGRRH